MTLTYAQAREKLIENDYAPTSALRPGAHGWRFNDDPAAVMCIPRHGGNCGVPGADKLTVITLNVLARDTKMRAGIVAALVKHGIKGPVRTDSAGNDAYIVRWEDYEPPHSDEIEASEGVVAFAVGGWMRGPRGENESCIVTLSGEWRGGNLLTVPRAKLPGIGADALKAIITDVRDVIEKHGPADKAPSRKDWSKGELSWKPYERAGMTGGLSGLTSGERAPFNNGARRGRSHRDQFVIDDAD